ncbi:hypothetical protein M422DRAFT_209673, partial [Sphaerobolus stellatus SS14]
MPESRNEAAEGRIRTNEAFSRMAILARNSGFVPSPVFMDTIKKNLIKFEEEYFKVSNFILDGEGSLGAIERQTFVGEGIESMKSLLSPMRRVPPEILGQIFTEC